MLIGDLNIGGLAFQGLGQYLACQFRAVVLGAQVRRYQRAQTRVLQRDRDATRRFIGEMSVWAANAPFQRWVVVGCGKQGRVMIAFK